jgi:hypothetical protein
LFDVIIFQQPHEEKLSRRVVWTESIVQHGIIDYLLTHMP